MTPSPSRRAWGRDAQALGARPGTRHGWRGESALLGATMFVAMALTACGASASFPSGAPSAPGASGAGQSYRSCLAAHRLVPKSAGTSSPSPRGTPGSAAATAARAACRSLRPHSTRRKYRSCLAAHGFTAKSAGTGSPSPGSTQSSTAARAARAACRSLRRRRAVSASPSPAASP